MNPDNATHTNLTVTATAAMAGLRGRFVATRLGGVNSTLSLAARRLR
jgi:hypothetical protein